MSRKPASKRTRLKPKAVLRLPDLDQAKSAVLNSLTSADAQRGYRHAIEEFVEWYCSEPRLSFSKTVVVRYRMHLESRHLAPGTINLRLGAVRRLAYEAADCGLLSSNLATGIQHVRGVKKQEQGNALWQAQISAGKPRGGGVTEQLVWHVVKEFAARIGNDRWRRTTCVEHAAARFIDGRKLVSVS